jgi:hypothetical protein
LGCFFPKFGLFSQSSGHPEHRASKVLSHACLFSADYENALAPKTINTESGSRISEPLPIYLNLDILSFDKVETI